MYGNRQMKSKSFLLIYNSKYKFLIEHIHFYCFLAIPPLTNSLKALQNFLSKWTIYCKVLRIVVGNIPLPQSKQEHVLQVLTKALSANEHSEQSYKNGLTNNYQEWNFSFGQDFFFNHTTQEFENLLRQDFIH